MTIISITICSQTSKIVFARQFTEINRKSLEEIIVEFSRMITLNKEVSCFESDKNRFLSDDEVLQDAAAHFRELGF